MNVTRSLPTLILLALATGCGDRNPKAVSMPPPDVLASKPVTRDVVDHQVFTARTQAVQSVDIKARVTGYLTKINFKDGSDVNAGDVLFEIDDRPYKAALDKAVAQVEVTTAALAKNQADYDIALNVQKRDKGAISQEDVNKAKGARDESQGQLDTAKANLETAKLNYGWCKVTAPISGRTNTHFVDVGNLVSQDMTTLTNMVSLKPTWAYFDVDDNTAEKVRILVSEGKIEPLMKKPLPVGMALSIDDDQFKIPGIIDFVSNQVDPNTASIRVRAVFPNDNGQLVAGQFGRIRVPMGQVRPALLVNDRAIGSNQGNQFVLALSKDDKVEMRIVDTGQLHGGLREVFQYKTVIETGPDGKGVEKKVEILSPDDRVIVDGLQRVRPGTVVKPTMVDMTTLLVEGSKSPPAKAAPAKVEPQKTEPVKLPPAKTEPATPKAEPKATAPPHVEVPAPPKIEPLKQK